jgi:prevent-host-death family protein
MGSMLFATNILPLARFKATASEVLNGMKENGRPVVITQNGEAAAVLLPPAEYDRLAYRASFLEAVEEGYADSVAGRTIDQSVLAAEIAARYGTEGKDL